MTASRLLPAVLLSALLAALSWTVGAGPALACGCAFAESETFYYDHADVVFAGRAIERREPGLRMLRSSSDPATYVFDVSSVYKGDAHATQEVKTAESGASCGLEIPARGEFLVFANQAEPGAALTANLCGGTRPLGESPVAFDEVGPPVPGTSATNDRGIPMPALAGIAGLAVVGFAGIAGALWLRLRRRPM